MITKINRRHLIILSIIICHLSLSVVLTSCDDYLTDDPKSQITTEEAYGTIDKTPCSAFTTISAAPITARDCREPTAASTT